MSLQEIVHFIHSRKLWDQIKNIILEKNSIGTEEKNSNIKPHEIKDKGNFSSKKIKIDPRLERKKRKEKNFLSIQKQIPEGQRENRNYQPENRKED